MPVDDSVASSPPRRTTVAGAVAMFGLVAGVGAILALFATVADWRDEAAQARWPVVSALIERGGVDPHRVSQSSGGGTVWQLHYRVRYEADGERVATLASRSASSDEETAELRAWAALHRRGGRIDIRYDPSQPARAVFASADVPNAGPRTGTDLRLLMIAATLCVALMALAKHLRSRETDAALAADSGNLSRSGRIAWGLAVAAMGFLAIGLGVHSALVATHPLTSEDFIGVPAAMIFVFGGALLALPPDRARLQRLIGTLLVTTFALTLDWVAFGPGTRQFGGGISFGIGIGFRPSEFFGRAVFGIFAAGFDIAAAVMWAGLIRQRRASGSTASL